MQSLLAVLGTCEWLTGLPDFSSAAWRRRSAKKRQTQSQKVQRLLWGHENWCQKSENTDQQFSPETARAPGLPPRPWAHPWMEGRTWHCLTPEAWSWFWTFSCCPRRPRSHWRRKTAFLWNPVNTRQGESVRMGTQWIIIKGPILWKTAFTSVF